MRVALECECWGGESCKTGGCLRLLTVGIMLTPASPKPKPKPEPKSIMDEVAAIYPKGHPHRNNS